MSDRTVRWITTAIWVLNLAIVAGALYVFWRLVRSHAA